MRFIDKRTICKALHRRRHNQPQNEVDAKKAWRRFNKKAIRLACYKQQRGICGYTELSLDDELLGCHLEHIAPRSAYPQRTFEMSNTILAAMDEQYSGQLDKQEQFGGHFKQALYNDDWFIGPFDRRCEQFFQYCEQTGLVTPNKNTNEADQLSTHQTIEVLNLNCAYLKTMRQQHLQYLKTSVTAMMESQPQVLMKQQEAFEDFRKRALVGEGNNLAVFYTAKKQLIDRMQREYF